MFIKTAGIYKQNQRKARCIYERNAPETAYLELEPQNCGSTSTVSAKQAHDTTLMVVSCAFCYRGSSTGYCSGNQQCNVVFYALI
ncbi:MAG: hypothetical protein IKT68_06850 [Clostridia bacterium]|nr:hypothetical protein [Clostridia bacterium]